MFEKFKAGQGSVLQENNAKKELYSSNPIDQPSISARSANHYQAKEKW